MSTRFDAGASRGRGIGEGPGLWAVLVLGSLFLAVGAAHAEAPAAGSGAAAEATGEVGAAGRVVHRFTPPVAAPVGASDLGAPRALRRDTLIRPCDSPGSGCRAAQASTPQIETPPIVPGSGPPQ